VTDGGTGIETTAELGTKLIALNGTDLGTSVYGKATYSPLASGTN
jgi:hypothetical protein